MKTVTFIMPLEETTVNNPSDSSGVAVGAIAGETAGVTVGALIDKDRAKDSDTIAQC